MGLIPHFERTGAMPRYSYNFRRQLEKAADRLSAKLALPAGTDLVIRPATADDMTEWRAWAEHPAMKDRHVSFSWGMLYEDDRRENQSFGRRTCVAFIARGQLCGLAHMMVSRSHEAMVLTQIETRPGRHPLRGFLSFSAIDAALGAAQAFGCTELYLGGPVYSARLAESCRAMGFQPYDDGTYIHYNLRVGPETRLDPARFFARAKPGAETRPARFVPGA